MMGISADQRFTFFVRSVVFMRHVSPRLVDLKKYCAAMYTTDGLCGEISKGAFTRQFTYAIVYAWVKLREQVC